jgi:16S rRNA (cytidine1402-2'-O)-methyltransferase
MTDNGCGGTDTKCRRHVAGQLFVVATPIGNLEDLSPRALATLKQVDLIACEDTRHTGKLLNHFGIKTTTTSFHEHNEKTKCRQILERIREGFNVALVSDAGTPLLSDPGFQLVKACRVEGLKVTPIPGPFAGATAVSVSGVPTDKIVFLGFLPKKKNALKKVLEEYSSLNASLVIYLSPHGISQTLKLIADSLGNRSAFLIREMTKLYETGYSGTIEEICNSLAVEDKKGEFTLVVGPPVDSAKVNDTVDSGAYVIGLMRKLGISSKEAISLAVKHLGKSKKEVYRAYLDSKE